MCREVDSFHSRLLFVTWIFQNKNVFMYSTCLSFHFKGLSKEGVTAQEQKEARENRNSQCALLACFSPLTPSVSFSRSYTESKIWFAFPIWLIIIASIWYWDKYLDSMVDSAIPSHVYWAPRNEITSNKEMDPACLVFSSGGYRQTNKYNRVSSMPWRGSRGHLSGNLVKQSRMILHSRGRPLSWGAGDHNSERVWGGRH